MKKIVSMTLIIVFILTVLFPFFYLISHSLKGEAYMMSIYCNDNYSLWQRIWIKPFYFDLYQYYEVFFRTPKFLYMFWNSIVLVVIIVIGQVIISFFAGYGFSKLKFPGADALFLGYIIIMLMPFQVTVVPNYITLSRLQLLDTRGSLILPGIFNTFGVFFLKQFMEGIDKDFIEEARMQGAREGQVLWHIIIPMCKPIITAVVVFIFIDYWSMVEQPIVFIKTTSKYPLSVFLNVINDQKKDISFTTSVLYMFLPVVLAIYAQGDLVHGLKITNLK